MEGGGRNGGRRDVALLDVRVRRVVENALGSVSLRSLEIRAGDGVVVTPSRCATGHEIGMNARHGLGIDAESRVAVYAKTIYRYDAISLMSSTDRSREFVGELKAFNAQRVPLSLCSLQIGDIAMGAPNEMLEHGDAQDRLLDVIIESQVMAGYGIVSVPHMGLNPDEARGTPHAHEIPQSTIDGGTIPVWLERRLHDVRDGLEGRGRLPLFSIDMGYFAFADVLRCLVNDLGSSMVNLLYRSPESAPAAYECLRGYMRRNVAFLVTNVPRVNAAHRQVSAIHSVPFWGGDLMALETKRGFGYPQRPNDTRKLRVFDSQTAGMCQLCVDDHLVRTIAQEAGVPEREVRGVFGSLDDAASDHGAYDRINSLLGMHELRVSTHKMAALASSIMAGDAHTLAGVASARAAG